MSDHNAYIFRAMRIEDGEIRWGQATCSSCKSRGWFFVIDTDFNQEVLDISACPCSPVHTDEDLDRLEERLFLIAHFYNLEDEGEPLDLPDSPYLH